MKMIDHNHAQQMIQKQFRINDNVHVVLATYKRDRKIEITKTGDKFSVTEAGYKRETVDGLTQKEALSQLKKRMKVEFPRSHKLYIAFK